MKKTVKVFVLVTWLTSSSICIFAQSNRDSVRVHNTDQWQDSTIKHLDIYKNDSVNYNRGIKPDSLHENQFRRIGTDTSIYKNRIIKDSIRK